jgi:hypothetical protein
MLYRIRRLSVFLKHSFSPALCRFILGPKKRNKRIVSKYFFPPIPEGFPLFWSVCRRLPFPFYILGNHHFAFCYHHLCLGRDEGGFFFGCHFVTFQDLFSYRGLLQSILCLLKSFWQLGRLLITSFASSQFRIRRYNRQVIFEPILQDFFYEQGHVVFPDPLDGPARDGFASFIEERLSL